MLGRRTMLGLWAAAIWAAPPLANSVAGGAGGAAWAKGGSNSGSGSSGSSSGSGADDDDNGNSGAGGSSGTSGKGKPGKPGTAIGKSRRLVFGGDGIHIQFFDGHIERIRAGEFELIDKSGALVDRHASTAGDLRRLRSLEADFAARGRASGIVTVAEIDEGSGRVEITDFRGWRETLKLTRYELSDPNGRTVTRRPLTPEDIVRVRTLLFLN